MPKRGRSAVSSSCAFNDLVYKGLPGFMDKFNYIFNFWRRSFDLIILAMHVYIDIILSSI